MISYISPRFFPNAQGETKLRSRDSSIEPVSMDKQHHRFPSWQTTVWMSKGHQELASMKKKAQKETKYTN